MVDDTMGVNKIEAGQRQLDSAIRLFFAGDDWISVHTLAAASGRILRDLAQQRGSSVWDIVNAHIPIENRAYVWRQLNKAANFFKHADRDPNDLLEGINPLVNDHLIYLNCLLFLELERRMTHSVSIFVIWHIGAYPDLFRAERTPIFANIKREIVSVFEDVPRPEQLALARAMLNCPLPGHGP
jgi:hypothetical protein